MNPKLFDAISNSISNLSNPNWDLAFRAVNENKSFNFEDEESVTEFYRLASAVIEPLLPTELYDEWEEFVESNNFTSIFTSNISVCCNTDSEKWVKVVELVELNGY